MNDLQDDRSTLAKAWETGSLVVAIAMQMVMPLLAGYWLDAYWGTVPMLTIVCGALGLGLGMWQLIRLANAQRQRRDPGADRNSKQD